MQPRTRHHITEVVAARTGHQEVGEGIAVEVDDLHGGHVLGGVGIVDDDGIELRLSLVLQDLYGTSFEIGNDHIGSAVADEISDMDAIGFDQAAIFRFRRESPNRGSRNHSKMELTPPAREERSKLAQPEKSGAQ